MSNQTIKTHRKDPRVAIVKHLDDFKTAVNKPEIQAVIVRRPRREIAAIKKLAANFSAAIEDDMAFGVAYKSSRKTPSSKIKTRLQSGAPFLPPKVRSALKQEAKIIANLWYAGTQTDQTINTLLITGHPTPQPHPHDYPVLTCAWNTKKGTLWAPPQTADLKNPANYTLHTKPGDLFFMKPNFWHASPPVKHSPFQPTKTEQQRLLLACLPIQSFV